MYALNISAKMSINDTKSTRTKSAAKIEMTNFILKPPVCILDISMMLEAAPAYINIPKWNGC